MTRRFRLSPIATQAGFAQTIVLPPAVRASRETAETPGPGGDCTGVAAPPTSINVAGSLFGCGPDEWPAQFNADESDLPAGYSLGQQGVCLDEEPETWPVVRECDGATFFPTAVVTYTGGS
ncbi:MAG: hypothetical protein ACK5PG_05870 [Lysobacterales bacterium]|jgi:hypothetical protein